MKYLILSIFVVIIIWPVWGLVTGDMDFGGMGTMIVGISFGFILRKISEPEPE